jgi:hypothetical protein
MHEKFQKQNVMALPHLPADDDFPESMGRPSLG